MDREAIFQALFAQTEGVQWNIGTQLAPVMEGFKKRTRRIALFSDVPDKEQPWLGQSEHGESISQVSRMPYKAVLQAQWVVYHVAAKQPNSIPTSRNNQILDALQAAIAPAKTDPGYPDERNTLGGLVYHCYIDGEVFKDPGDIDNQGMLVVPIRILVP